MSDKFEGYEQYAVPNWDGYDGLPITPKTLQLAKALDALLSEPPHIAPSADGTIGFEWINAGNDKVFLDVSESGISIYARIGTDVLMRFKR